MHLYKNIKKIKTIFIISINKVNNDNILMKTKYIHKLKCIKLSRKQI